MDSSKQLTLFIVKKQSYNSQISYAYIITKQQVQEPHILITQCKQDYNWHIQNIVITPSENLEYQMNMIRKVLNKELQSIEKMWINKRLDYAKKKIKGYVYKRIHKIRKSIKITKLPSTKFKIIKFAISALILNKIKQFSAKVKNKQEVYMKFIKTKARKICNISSNQHSKIHIYTCLEQLQSKYTLRFQAHNFQLDQHLSDQMQYICLNQ